MEQLPSSDSKIRQFFDLAVRHGFSGMTMLHSTTNKFGSPGYRGTNRLPRGKLNGVSSFAVSTHNVQSRRKHGRIERKENAFISPGKLLFERKITFSLDFNELMSLLKELPEGQL